MNNLMKLCRVCRAPLSVAPLLEYHDMPGSAQGFPCASELGQDNGADLILYQCRSCGLVQLADEPVPYFRDVIRAAAFSAEMGKFRRKQFADFVEVYGLRGQKVLEVGCGRGEYLRLMQETGMTAYGIENSAASVSECVGAGLKVQKGFVDSQDCHIQDAPFDAFMILNFLEHLPEPVETLRGIAANLADSAVGLVEMPNLDMILKNNLFSELISDHLLYFTRETLSQALAMGGFQVLSCDEVWHGYILSATVRKRQRLDLTGFHQALSSLKNELNAFIDTFPTQSVAVWGAGHQALAVIALTDIAGKIKYVIDSAPFKQGKFTPATHIPIVAPEKLQMDTSAAIIVMAASYTDEVIRILQKQNLNIAIAALRSHGLEILSGAGSSRPCKCGRPTMAVLI